MLQRITYVIAISCFSLAGFSQGHPDDVAALKAIYLATNGDNWNTTIEGNGWEVSCNDCDICSWHGIWCNDDGRVNGLNLHYKGLKGALPSEVGLLSELEYLYAHQNPNLIGPLPDELDELSKLIQVIFDDSGLTGTIPNFLNNKPFLEKVNFSENNLSGPIPEYLGNLIGTPNLEHINLRNNNFTGSIPQSLTTVSSLRHLDLSFNKLTGIIPPGFGDMPHLESFDIFSNDIRGCFPDDLMNWCRPSIDGAPNDFLINFFFDKGDFSIDSRNFCDGELCDFEDCETEESFLNRIEDDFTVSSLNNIAQVTIDWLGAYDQWFPLWGDDTHGGAGYFLGSGTYPVGHHYGDSGKYTICINIETYAVTGGDTAERCHCKVICKEITIK